MDLCMMPRWPHELPGFEVEGRVEQLKLAVAISRASKKYRATEAEMAMSGDAQDFGVGRIIWLLFRRFVGRS